MSRDGSYKTSTVKSLLLECLGICLLSLAGGGSIIESLLVV